MLILPPGHAEAVSNQRRLTGRERRTVGAVGAVVAVLVALTLFAFTSGTTQPRKGCINVTFQSSLGGQVLSGCGSDARAMCAAIGTPGGYSGAAAEVLSAQCRKQGIKVG
ncbi:MAG: hypothetical protein ACLP8S_07695 [Solirubrobacteraceae bacterium]